MLMFCFVPICNADSDTLQIAVIGPMTGKDHESGQAMLDGVNLYVNEVNKSGGINGRTLEVIAYDDQNNKVMARNRAMEIAKESKTLVVIGHYYSSISLEGGKIYSESFQRQFVKMPSETRSPGHYKDGIYAATFFISDSTYGSDTRDTSTTAK